MRWLPVDLGLVSVFAAIGRISHDESLSLTGWWHTAWPFLVGAVAGALLVRIAGRPGGSLVAGGLVVAATVVVGMLLRSTTGAGTAASFVVVATVVLTGLLLGAWLVARRI